MTVLSRWVSGPAKLIRRIVPLPQRYSDLERLVNNFDRRQNPPAILFLGDSVVERISDQDKDRRTLDMMLASRFASKRIVCIAHSAYHLEVYLGLVAALERLRHKPEMVILPINLRSFSPQWDFEPSWQFEQEIRCLWNFANTGSRDFVKHEVDLTSAYEEFDARPVSYPLTSLDQIGQFRLVINGKPVTEAQRNFRTRQLFIFHYMYSLPAEHPKIKALEAILEQLQTMKVKVLVYVTPVNHEAGKRFAGDEFVRSVRSNVGRIIRSVTPFLKSPRVSFEDYSEFLGDRYFFNPANPTEHLNQDGRLALVARLTAAISKLGVLSSAGKARTSS